MWNILEFMQRTGMQDSEVFLFNSQILFNSINIDYASTKSRNCAR